MLYLAVEQSTAKGSMALLHDTRLLSETHWDATRHSTQTLGRVLSDWQARGTLDLAEVDCFVLGIGPGAYSSLRYAAALLNAAALPDARMLYALSSAETLAWQLAPDYDGKNIMILGDARREHYWYRVYRSRGLAPPLSETDWEVCAPDQLPWSDGLVVATADWERIEPTLRQLAPSEVTLIPKAVYPEAASLARLAAIRLADAIPSEPPYPIYPHAPVKNA